MCGRYFIQVDDPQLRAVFAAVEQEERMKTGEIFPNDSVPALTADGDPRLMQWGFTRYNGGGKVINARSETATEKNMFAKAMRERRCLLPASNYFEWQRSGGVKKQKFAISLPDNEPLYMAGLYRLEKNVTLPVFVILTRQAAQSVSNIHDRMPVILPKAVLPLWLNCQDAAQLLNMAVTGLKAEPV